MRRPAAFLQRALRNHPGIRWRLRALKSRAQRILYRRLVASNRRAVLDGEIWTLDRLEVDAGTVTAAGWLLPPPGQAPVIALNGRPFEALQLHARPDVADLVWQREGAGEGGFLARSNDPSPFRDGYLRISFENAPTIPHAGLGRDFFLLDPALEPTLPPEEHRLRVLGNVSESGFRLSGATDFGRIRAAAKLFGERPFASFQSMLDWGVGCGRLARYATREVEPGRFHGCDIDSANVAWCSSHLEGAYRVTGRAPPLPFDEAAFDLVYGVSVFTHLHESLQDAWLAELRRVLRPGGLALVTIHGRTALAFSYMRPPRLVEFRDELAARGIVVIGDNYDLEGAVPAAQEYVNVFHDEAYVRRHWSRGFEVLAVLPGYIHTHDLVVLRRPSA